VGLIWNTYDQSLFRPASILAAAYLLLMYQCSSLTLVDSHRLTLDALENEVCMEMDQELREMETLTPTRSSDTPSRTWEPGLNYCCKWPRRRALGQVGERWKHCQRRDINELANRAMRVISPLTIITHKPGIEIPRAFFRESVSFVLHLGTIELSGAKFTTSDALSYVTTPTISLVSL
jgi:hypothetical protein